MKVRAGSSPVFRTKRRKFELQTTASIFQEGRCGSNQNSAITRKRPEGFKPPGLFCYQFFATYRFFEFYKPFQNPTLSPK